MFIFLGLEIITKPNNISKLQKKIKPIIIKTIFLTTSSKINLF